MSTGAFDCGKKAKMMMEEYDRLSDLPDSLIQDIFRFLPTRDVIRTTILSKRWKKLWTTFPWLDFNNVTMKMGSDEFRNFVDQALKSWRGNKMFRLDVEFDHEVGNLLNDGTDDFDSWLRLAVEKKVEALKLRFPLGLCHHGGKKLYLLAQDLYSCSSLKRLLLTSCDLQIHGNVQWDQLKILKILCKSVSQNAIDKVLCGSPRLEIFSLYLRDSKENLSIRSSSLKYLTLVPSMEAEEMRIWTPNLEYLCIGMIRYGYSKCLLMNNMPSLRVADLDFHMVPQRAVREMLTQILPVIKHVKRVSLKYECIKALGAMKEKGTVSSFPNVNFLELRLVCCEEYEQIVGVLELFPRLKDLGIRTSERNGAKNMIFELEKNAKSFLPKLRRVCVTCAKGDESIIPLIQILVKYARNLKKLVFWEEQGEERKLLLKMEKSSSNEELKFDLAKLRLQSGDIFYSGDYF